MLQKEKCANQGKCSEENATKEEEAVKKKKWPKNEVPQFLFVVNRH